MFLGFEQTQTLVLKGFRWKIHVETTFGGRFMLNLRLTVMLMLDSRFLGLLMFPV